MAIIFIGLTTNDRGRTIPMHFDTDYMFQEDYAKYCELSDKIKKLDEIRSDSNKRIKGLALGIYSDELWKQTRIERASLINKYTNSYVDYRFCGKEDEI